MALQPVTEAEQSLPVFMVLGVKEGYIPGHLCGHSVSLRAASVGKRMEAFTKVSNPNAREGRGRAVNERRLRDLVAMETRNRTPHQPDMTTVRI